MQQLTDKNICILNLTSNEVRDFFLKSESYFTLEMPTYFVFDQLLNTLSSTLLTEGYITEENPLYKDDGRNIRNQDNVNYLLFNNKDGKYAWRPLQIINPAIYVSLVHKIAEDDNWKYIQERFETFKENPKIECTSLPVKSLNQKKDKAAQICEWWEKIEQRSIELALEYEYLIKTDITDCYGSIYTHSVAWALHGKEDAKKERRRYKLLGNLIDGYIQDMSHGQTNGIPQGSVLMDFIAEMVLGYADFELSNKIQKESSVIDYHILRYRDDYRIFINNSQDGDVITKLLAETLIDLGLQLNAHKTQSTHNIIRDSIKSDKLFWITQHKNEKDLQKMLIIIHNLAEQFPNTGSISRALNEYNNVIFHLENIKVAPLPLISIVTDIAYHNPRVLPEFATILSKLLTFVDNGAKQWVLKKIQDRFRKIPNTGHLELWLQRVSIKLNPHHSYDEFLCKLVSGEETNSIWGLEGIDNKLQDIIKDAKIIDQAIIDDLPDIIQADEFNIFHNSY